MVYVSLTYMHTISASLERGNDDGDDLIGIISFLMTYVCQSVCNTTKKTILFYTFYKITHFYKRML